MPLTIDQKLGLSDYVSQRTIRRRVGNPAAGVIYYRNPNMTFVIVGGGAITVRLFIEDNKGTGRHRIKLYWTDSRDSDADLHNHSVGYWKHVSGQKVYDMTRAQQSKTVLQLAGIEVR